MPQGASLPEVDGKIPLSRDALDRIAKVLIQEIVMAAKREFTRRKWPLMSPDGRTNIAKSFTYKVQGNGGIEIASTFPGLENYATGIPIKRDSEGKLIVYQGAAQFGDIWVHPGAGGRNFLAVGLDKGMEKAASIIVDEAMIALFGGS